MLRRAAQVATTTTAAVNNAATAVPVSSTAGWLPGMALAIGDAGRAVGWSVNELKVLSVGSGALILDKPLALRVAQRRRDPHL